MTRLLSFVLLLSAGISAPALSWPISVLAEQELIFNVGALGLLCRRQIEFVSQPPAWIEAHRDEIRLTPTKAEVGHHKFAMTCLQPSFYEAIETRQKIVNGQVEKYTITVHKPMESKLSWDLEITVVE